MKISVVTVCYNASDLIEPTIKSVIDQTYSNLEYIIIDGGSTDGTIDIIKKHSDNIAYWVSEPDKGIYDAMNKGISAATGDYICFMNAGDVFSANNVLEKIAPHLNGQEVVYGKWHRCYSDGKRKLAGPLKIDVLKVEMAFCHQAAFVKLPYHKNNPFDTSYRFSADYDFFYKAWKTGKSFLCVDVIIADYLEGGFSGNNYITTVLERERAWDGENNLFFRKLHLRYQIARIKTVKFLKKITTLKK